MDDRTKGVGSERMTGRDEETRAGRVEQPSSTRGYEAAPSTAAERSGSAAAGESGSRRTDATATSSADPRTHQIRADIERTRDDMSETIDAIQDRLRPSTIASNAAASVREAASDRIQDVADSEFVQEIRANPAPTIMIGIGLVGLAWLAWGGGNAHSDDARGRYRAGSRRRSGASYSPRDEYRGREWRGDVAGGYSPGLTYGEQATGGSSGTGLDSGGIGSQAREYADDTRRALRQSTRRAQNGLQRMMHQNPLLVGAAAAAVGAVIGMALPESERENQLMGDARDQVIDNVQSMAKGAAERVQNAASEAVERVQNVASESVGLVTDTSDDKQ